MLNFNETLNAFTTQFEAECKALLSGKDRLSQAMNYSVMNGGKRLRPFLVVESAKLFNIPQSKALKTALALEFIHCYSLIHDDLPSMDNDDLRRGKPTLHKSFDEATAILAGDALLTLAFEILSESDFKPEITLQLIKLLSQASGNKGMVGGQMLDLAAEGRFEKNKPLSQNEILHLQALKTGALLHFACISGAIMASENTEYLSQYGKNIGLAFQIKDDILDHTGDEAKVGKKLNKDASANKGTLVSLMGLEQAKSELEKVTNEALNALSLYGEKANILKQCALFIAHREK